MSEEQVALAMILLKIARETCTHKRDNLVDVAGYTETLAMIHEAKGTL